MAQIGSTVIYMGTKWSNHVYGTQPVWGVKKSPANDEKCADATAEKKKSFAEYLKEAAEKKDRR